MEVNVKLRCPNCGYDDVQWVEVEEVYCENCDGHTDFYEAYTAAENDE
jgi:predicted nucleic-acid-binding Zn-ribbon protein